MSDAYSTEPIGPGHDASGLTSFETAGPSEPPGGGSRRTVIAGVAVSVVALLAGGAYAAYAFLDGGGARPADVLPTSTVAVVSVDLDPAAGQKIAAIKTIRRFPTLKKTLGLQADDDVRKYVYDQIVDPAACKGLDFHDDVLPWIGKRAAFAVVDLGEAKPSPAVVLQITDKDKARRGFGAIVDCTHPSGFAFVVGDDYLVASDTAAHAQKILDEGRSKPLADDAAYQKWTGEAGDAGVVNFYVAAGAANYAEQTLDGLSGNLFGMGASPFTVESSNSTGSSAAASKALRGFRGMAGTVRFSGGGMEIAVAAGGLKQAQGLTTVGQQVGDLPSDTAVVFGLGVSKDFAAKLVEPMSRETLKQAESESGLDLPGDLETLLGNAVTVSLGGNTPASLDAIKGPEDVPLGLVIHGDADKIKAIITKVEDRFDLHLSDVPVSVDTSGDMVAVSTGGYGDDLLKDGSLGSDSGFRAAVPNADRAGGVLYVDFDSKWRDLVVDSLAKDDSAKAAAEFDANTKPLRGLGVSSWRDGDVSHGLLKITTD